MNYYSHHTGNHFCSIPNFLAMMFTPDPPLVGNFSPVLTTHILVKVGYAEAGYGKMMFKDSSALGDFKRYMSNVSL